MTTTVTHEAGDAHHHEHPAWLAHHFDDAEQQYDAGKLGMWLFLVTEVLFFSGMFCAYSLYRNRNPEVFQFCSQFLNAKLGAINTGVLLFSSLTMAWAVRASQLKQHRTLTGMLAATLGCAAIFLGVKAVEYSHKWELGLLPGKLYQSQVIGAEHVPGPYLNMLCAVPLVLLVSFVLYYGYARVIDSTFHARVAGPLAVAAVCFFGGVGLGLYLQSLESHGEGHASHGSHGAGQHSEPADHSDHADHGGAPPLFVSSLVPVEESEHDVSVSPALLQTPQSDVNQKGMAGLFFSIYYCMTGIHAIHILGGMVVITWLIVKAARLEFHSEYFGPVDNVGLYWHLVDFIWIYLFPLLYLIT